MTSRRLAVLVAALVAQQLFLVWTVWQGERTVSEGVVVRLALRGADPVDPIRGRYVTFQVLEDRPRAPDTTWCDTESRLVVVFGQGDDDMATVTEVRTTPPTTGAWMYAEPVRWDAADDCRASLGLDRFYLNEADAPLADAALREASAERPGWLEVSLSGGRAVITALVVDGQRFGS
ncbi:MAG: GDYXXLXY domain-containing protein [Alphaproteobacteria bacterium]|nr:GDYXXLXY domain-containing protein [Alphaproteobacteria bacterium]